MASCAAKRVKHDRGSYFDLPMTITEEQLAIFRNPTKHTGFVVGRGADDRKWEAYLEKVRHMNDTLSQD